MNKIMQNKTTEGNKTQGVIFNIQRFCLHDGDGIRTTVFLKGCPLKCIWCHNPESQQREMQLITYASKCTICGRCITVCDNRRIEDGRLIINRDKCKKCGRCVDVCLNEACDICGKYVTAEEVMKEVVKDKVFYETSNGGMTISGGEPLHQPAFSLELLRLAKDENIDAAIETCGFGQWDFFEKARSLGASFLYDIKTLDSEKHKKLTGADNSLILDNLKKLIDIGADITLRFPLVPGINDSEKELDCAAELIKRCRGHIKKAEVMAYHNLGIGKERGLGRTPALDIESATAEKKREWEEAFKKRGAEIAPIT
jgi:pyruvate formate lyase activating enzyme